MRTCLLLFVSMLFVVTAFSQEESAVDTKTSRKLTKQQKQEQKRIEEEATIKRVEWMIEKRRFVLKADFLSNKTGQRVMVNSELNFIIIDSAEVTIQLASMYGTGGTNTMGGVTTSGPVLKYEATRSGKNKTNFYIQISTITTLGSFDISFMISSLGNADATVSGISRGKANYHGEIVPIQGSRIYKAPGI